MRRSTTKKRKVSGVKKNVGSTRRRRRSKVGAAGDISGMFMKVGGLAAGAIIARELNVLLSQMSSSLNSTIAGGIQVGLGVMLPLVVKGNSFVSDIGDGMIANGGLQMVVSTGIMTGPPQKMTYRINGPGQLTAVAGTDQLSVVAGLNRPRLRNQAAGASNKPSANVKHIY